jgi:Type IV secretion-system coupling protein DNA-binding domain
MHTNHEYILGTLSTGESMPLLQADRRRHLYAVGQTGTGKTGFLTSLMHADLVAGAGFAFLDPHGDASQHIAGLTPKTRMNDVIYLDPSDPTHSFAYNPLAGVPEAERATATANIVSAFKNIWHDSWGPRLEYILTNALRLLLDTRDQSLLGLPRLLVDDTYRAFLLKGCRDPVINAFWRMEYARYENRQRLEAIAPVQNKIGILLSNPFIRSILCQNSSTLDIPKIMNTGQVLIVNLSKGNLGTEPAHLLGALLITAFAQAAEGRRAIPEEQRRDFTLYVDEFQNFATDSFATILSEARKWRLSLVCANQQVSSQLPDSLRDAIFGNTGTLVAFRTGALDAAFLADQLGMRNRLALTQTNNFHAWVRLMRDGMPLEAKSVATPSPPPHGTGFQQARASARSRHMRQRGIVEAKIGSFFQKSVAIGERATARRNPDKQ